MKILAALLAITVVATGCSSSSDDQKADAAWPDKITYGHVPSTEQENLQDQIQPFVDMLSTSLGIEVEGVVTTDYTGLVTAMGTGKATLGVRTVRLRAGQAAVRQH